MSEVPGRLVATHTGHLMVALIRVAYELPRDAKCLAIDADMSADGQWTVVVTYSKESQCE